MERGPLRGGNIYGTLDFSKTKKIFRCFSMTLLYVAENITIPESWITLSGVEL